MKKNKMDAAVALYFMAANNYLHLCQLCHLKNKLKARKRRKWMITIHKSRTPDFIHKMFSDLTAEPAQFFNFLRMSTTDFEILLQKVAPIIIKKDTSFREAIPAKVRLAVTLRYLATGDSFRNLHYLFKMSHQIISEIVHETCNAILKVLEDQVKIPTNEQEWLEKEADFHNVFPHCVAAMDGKHVVILAPHHSGSEFYNYKHTYSIVLLALVDKKYKFIFADVGCQGRISDGDVFRNSLLFRKLSRDDLNLPAPSPLPGCDVAMPYVFVADNAFPLHTNIMKPFPGEHPEGSLKRNFNRKLSQARIVVENVFGVMSAIFQVLRKPIPLQPDRASNIVMTCILLHNFLRNSKTSNIFYTPPDFMDRIENNEVIPGAWRKEQPVDGALRSLTAIARRNASISSNIRDKFAQVLVNR